jgi:septal ring factor EnvC (AmiA/AmiB activator)
MNAVGVRDRATVFRDLGLAMTLLALIGWGGFAYAAKSSTSARDRLQEEIGQLRQEVTRLGADQGRITAERDEARGQLAAVQGQLAAARQEMAALRKQLDAAQAKSSETGSVASAAPPGAGAPARTSKKRR